MGYPERLAHLGLEYLQVRRLKCDLLLCYKIINCKVVIHDLDFLVFSDCSVTRGHKCKLFKRHSNVNAYKYFYTNRICDVWNSLPDLVVDVPSVPAFRRLLDRVDLVRYCA